MTNVVHVNFAERRAFLNAKESYLHCVAANLDEMDFQDFVDAVNHPNAFAELDEDMKELVRGFVQLEG